MRAAVDGVDVVRKTEHTFGVSVVVLDADFHGDAIALVFHVDRFFMQHLLAAVQMLDELRDAAGVLEFGDLGFARFGVGVPLVGQRDDEALVQERQLAQARRQGVKVVFGCRKNGTVGEEVNLGAALLRRSSFLQLGGGVAFGVTLFPGKSIAPDFQIKFFAQRIHAGNADTVQSARDFVRRRIELTSGVQRGQYNLRGWNLFAFVLHHIHWDTATVVDHRHRVIDVDGDFNFVSVARKRFVHGVVHHFVNEMVQSDVAGRADVHGGTFAHSLHATKDFDGIRVVVAIVDGSHFAALRFCVCRF